MKKQLILGLRQEIYKMILELLVVPQSKKVLGKKKHIDGDVSKEHQSQSQAPSGTDAGII